MDLCSTHSSALVSQCVRVNCAAVALYACRSLERVASRQVVLFEGSDSAAEEVSEVEQERVQAVLAEARDPGYWFQASQDGNRKKHYTDPCMGATLVHPLQSSFFAPAEVCRSPGSEQSLSHSVGWSSAEVETRRMLVRHIRAFRKAVDAALPGVYYWFADESLHVTLRGLM
ncbi:hypothetical protein H632_c596p1 [Helicosporidium sp. ATCC 50920]|nr:hypothetical protein H632_c596p1 [Helicosporidium sp. ATCC 50920]|eukprot:KDD75607.1 hypothetical protein H632_c596p1 [Helicosporidium sp. ATCC 50920]